MNGIFAIEKPSGISSNQFLQKLKHALTKSQVFSKEVQRAVAERAQQYQKETGRKPSKHKLRRVSQIKMGHGGTLDPMASGVMVIGIGNGTKKLAEYLSGTVKVYEAEALFGVSTTSGDVEGDILSQNSVKHLNIEDLKSIQDKFVGLLKQTPPIYAALKMNGKPLYEYAREGIPLPKAIEPREVNVYELKLCSDCLSTDHGYNILRPASDEVKSTISKLNANLSEDTLYFSKEYCEKQGWEDQCARVGPPIMLTEEEREVMEKLGNSYRAPLLHFKTKVSSGTYIRSLISDIGKAMKTSSYMVKLIRCEQQHWSLSKNNVFKLEDFTNLDERVWRPVLCRVLELGSEVNVQEELRKLKEEVGAETLKQASEVDTEIINPADPNRDANSDIQSERLKKRKIEEI
ncbi:pseudouridine synthase PUS4 Ecym_3532 [Eremothecium cymbalariae DBVPG|uniref:tRNA pseudouridine(55) synthase n=1 Tax=Eremothecium cymbalariae (strain CBS 270.75 / DBVPG 7215 / KCTC 17166 / NRRL Y-17582) TaxID=931890 RepID=G8JQM5_ERECY|nr:Hypothetical protein Ecym_3532 [Eremothecium cymbalariae DBVPG\